MPSDDCRREKDILVFQDLLQSSGDDVSSVFFELANSSRVAYRLESSDESSIGHSPDSVRLVIQQDVSACLQHTGGIVWETCYLLLTYLIKSKQTLGNVLEVGAGCGLLGQGLVIVSKNVILTECLEAFDNLQNNLQRNKHVLECIAPNVSINCCVLDWLDRDTAASVFLPFDTIVGTDVLFSPKLVCPLLQTLQRFSHSNTRIYLCVQIRCPTSHSLFLEKAGSYDLTVSDVTETVLQTNECQWGRDMECLVLLLTRSTTAYR